MVNKMFSTPEITGVIGYRLSYGCAVVLGEPICSPSDVVILTKAFHQFMDKQDMPVIYLIVSQDFAQWAIGNVCGSTDGVWSRADPKSYV